MILPLYIKKTIARVEAFFKGVAFDCRACGQCVLSNTHLICPMTCPKGLRNGPCGGTINGMCEVYPDKECVWIRIYQRISRSKIACPGLNPTPDSALFYTSSYLNFLSGVDKRGREQLDYLQLGHDRTHQPVQTASRLERQLKAGKFVKTSEIRSPRSTDFNAIHREAAFLQDHFDAVNATANLNGKPSMPSSRVAAELGRLGIDAIAQSTCRDHTKTTFISELINNHSNNVHNVLCLTGDSYAGTPKIKQVFDMDSSLMLYEARYLRETGKIHFTGEETKDVPKPFLGAAINPFTTPANVPILRLKQKAAAGADFIQTQLIFDLPRFVQFVQEYRDQGLDRDLFLLAGIPVVTSAQVLAMLPHIPGVHCPEAIMQRLQGAKDLRQEGCLMARELVEAVREIPGINGVHLMLLGSDHSVLPDIISDLD